MTLYLRLLFLSTFVFTSCFSLLAQSKKKILFQAEAGIGVSVGKNKSASKVLVAPYATLEYLSHIRYRLPVLRLRGEASYQLLPRLTTGIRTGTDIIYYEGNSYGEYETYFAPLIQALANYSVLNLGKSSYLLLTGASGWKFRKKNYPPFDQRGGMVWNLELSRHQNKSRGSFYYKLGVEQATENWKYHYNSQAGIKQTAEYRQHRRVSYASIGWHL